MSNRNYVVIAVVSAAVIIGVVLASVFGKRIFSHNKEKALTLLQSNEKISINGSNEAISSRGLIEEYYELFEYASAWSGTDVQSRKNRALLRILLSYADSMGLSGGDFHRDYLHRYDSLALLTGFDGSVFETENELIFNDAALSFLFEAAYGQPIPKLSFEGVKYRLDTVRVLTQFHELLSHQNPQRILDSLEPQNNIYRNLKTALTRFEASLRKPGFLETNLPKDEAKGKSVAIGRLRNYGLLPSSGQQDSVSATAYQSALVEFQKMMGADSTGKLDVSTRTELSVPISRRISAIKQSLNHWRWINRLEIENGEFILVNIASARLVIVSPDSSVNLHMKVIVGKSDTRTPSFTAYITKVITYPYWTVPRSIAVKEMLPKIIRKRSYLDDNNLQVINTKGEEVNPSFIAWSKLSKNYFPYTIRQSTGCDNSLGLMKFDLNSPFSIYLHDTNAPGLFGKKERHMSHGCVRVEKPKELARFILDRGPDTLLIPRIDSCLKDQKPNDFKLKKRVPVLLLYMTADIDETGLLKFHKDVYRKETEEKK